MSNGDNIYINSLDNYLKPLQTPFDADGKTDAGNCFIYLTNSSSGGWSYLFEADKYSAIVEEAYQKISMGYTQLWIFEKRYSVNPDNEIIITSDFSGELKLNTEYPKEITRDNWISNLYVVFKSPIRADSSDIVSYHTDEDSAVTTANHYCASHKTPTLVGLMKADMYWH